MMQDKLERAFYKVYQNFKLQYYKKIFKRSESRETGLSPVETYCVDAINALQEPTINEFAKFVNISQENAAYKIQHLIRKGYVVKKRSETDKREYHLCMGDRFFDYLRVNTDYVGKVIARVKERFSEQETDVFEHILSVMASELMPEISQ
jgi:DNA-binding MarR family transcriptional regulator